MPNAQDQWVLTLQTLLFCLKIVSGSFIRTTDKFFFR